MNTPQFIIDELNKGLDGFTSTTIDMPTIGDRLLVKLRSSDMLLYAIYSTENEFDVHLVNGNAYPRVGDYRKAWAKYSKATVKSWKRIDDILTKNNGQDI